MAAVAATAGERGAVRMLFAGELGDGARSAFEMGGRIQIEHVSGGREACALLSGRPPLYYAVVATKLSGEWPELIEQTHQSSSGSFVLVWSKTAGTTPSARQAAFSAGAHMVSCVVSHVVRALEVVLLCLSPSRRGDLSCPSCGLKGLDATALWHHYPLHHVNDRPRQLACPICREVCAPMGPHLFSSHPPAGVDVSHEVARAPKLYAFALVVCIHPHTRKMLLVHEFASSGFWVPGGRVDPGEGLAAAAVRETLEEAGVRVRLTGLLRFETSPHSSSYRIRVIFLAEPEDPDNAEPKSWPDFESCGATWASEDEIMSGKLKFRGSEPYRWMEYLQKGGAVYPLDILDERL
eukprot:a511382_14.p1 GENE.a511382_14~~a511382_14.p1  ORF type:complete len:364 (-),score=108.24 a511382_14:247-1299(-)